MSRRFVRRWATARPHPVIVGVASAALLVSAVGVADARQSPTRSVEVSSSRASTTAAPVAAPPAPAAVAGGVVGAHALAAVRLTRTYGPSAAEMRAAQVRAIAAANRAARQRAARERRTLAAATAPATITASKSYARAEAARRGWGSREFACVDALWTKESGWIATADNPNSSAYGIPQALPGERMAAEGPAWARDPRTQIRWGMRYIDERYGRPCAAWAHSRALNWY